MSFAGSGPLNKRPNFGRLMIIDGLKYSYDFIVCCCSVSFGVVGKRIISCCITPLACQTNRRAKDQEPKRNSFLGKISKFNGKGGKKLSRTFVRIKGQKINGEGLLTTHRTEAEVVVEEVVGQERHGRDSVDDGENVVELEGPIARGGRGTRACATAPGGYGYVSLQVLNGWPIKRNGP